MTRFVKYAWFVVAYTIGVILWGAVVRATGSGAGCGNHWPACNGEVIPRAETMETFIEFSHRLTSGFAGILVIILLIWAFRLKPVQRFVRWFAALSFVFILIEGGIGAALVRLELVEDNASILRSVMIGLHLVNTLVLLLMMTLTAWGGMHRLDRVRFDTSVPMGGGLLLGLLGYAIVSAFGAVTALGDTLISSGALERQGYGLEHFIVQLRVIHPFLAVGVSAFLCWLLYLLQRSGDERVETLSMWAFFGVAGQVGLGILNIALAAPIWMQIVHLLVADLIWILLIVLSARVMLAPVQKTKPIAEAPRPAVALGD